MTKSELRQMIREVLREELNSRTGLTESYAGSIRAALKGKLDAVSVRHIAPRIINRLLRAGDVTETDMTVYNDVVVFSSKTNGDYEIRKADLAVVEKVNLLANAVYECNYEQVYDASIDDASIAGYEIFQYLLGVLNIPFQCYFD
jgi:hypothetical protein